MEERTRIYTDGSCLGNPGPGGWAWAINPGVRDAGYDPRTTNQRMELKAVVEALRSNEEPVVIITDSAYIVNCFEQEWYDGWTANGYKTKTGDKVANWDLWFPLLKMVWAGDVEFEKVKGHSGDKMNEYVDGLARAEAEIAKKQSHRGRGHRHR